MNARTNWGGEFTCDLRDLVQSRIYYFRVWEPSLTALIQARLKEGDVFLDVGANVGYYTVLASRAVGDSGRVVAIEASPRVCSLLRDTVERNRAENVRVVHAAVSDRDGSIPIYAGPVHNVGATSIRKDWHSGGTFESEVRAAPLRSLLEPSELTRARLLKIDVEGAELPVLLDLLSNLDAFSPNMEIVVEVTPVGLQEMGMTFEELVRRFEAHGFAWYTLDNDYSLASYFDPTVQEPRLGTSSPDRQVDVLFSRDQSGASAFR
jgi:FkbM family methyltransferase